MSRPFDSALRAFKATPNRETAFAFFQEVIRRCGDHPNQGGYVYREGARYKGVRVYGTGRKDQVNYPSWLILFSGQNDVTSDEEHQFWFELHTTPCLEEVWVLPKPEGKRLPVVENIQRLVNQMLGA